MAKQAMDAMQNSLETPPPAPAPAAATTAAIVTPDGSGVPVESN
jgi:hypothetical protein